MGEALRSPPREEEDPEGTSYAAAEGLEEPVDDCLGDGTRRTWGYYRRSAGGGKSLRMSR